METRRPSLAKQRVQLRQEMLAWQRTARDDGGAIEGNRAEFFTMHANAGFAKDPRFDQR